MRCTNAKKEAQSAPEDGRLRRVERSIGLEVADLSASIPQGYAYGRAGSCAARVRCARGGRRPSRDTDVTENEKGGENEANLAIFRTSRSAGPAGVNY